MTINIGLNETQVDALVKVLSGALGDLYVLYTKTRNYHWNVTGPQFNDLHKFFESQYDAIDESIDEMAEFIRYYGRKSPGSLAEFLKLSQLKEAPEGDQTAKEMAADLLADHETVIRSLRAGIATAEENGSPEVADFLTGKIEEHSKMAWMLRAIAK